MKKTLFFAAAIIFSLAMSAQQSGNGQYKNSSQKAAGSGVGPPIVIVDSDNVGFSRAFDSISTGLIKSRIPRGILYDRVFPWANVDEIAQGDFVSTERFVQAWMELQNSVVNMSDRVNGRNDKTIKSIIAANNLNGNSISLMAIRQDFGTIDENSFDDGRASIINGMIKDNNLAQIPYFTKQALLSALSVEKVKAGVTYNIRFSNIFVLDNPLNGAATLSKITIYNETTGESVNVSLGQTIPYAFNRSGVNIIRLTMTLSNGTTFYTKQNITVVGTPVRSLTDQNREGIVESDIAFKGYEETAATTSIADYHVWYHYNPGTTNPDTKLRKPVIVVDGYDPGDTRDHNEIYNNYLRDENGLLGEKLRAEGYDIIVLNFPTIGSYKIQGKTQVSNGNTASPYYTTVANRDGGADYIERNSFLLVKLIQSMNAELTSTGSTEKLVVVGPSMGGQISRYALAYMEKQQAAGVPNMNHNTRLYVSFDSPHEGANIPISMQTSLLVFGRDLKKDAALNTYNTQIRSVAGRQLLIEQLDGKNNSSLFRTRYMSNLTSNGVSGSNGWPVNLRKISLVDGSGNGRVSGMPGDEVLGLQTVVKEKILKNNSIKLRLTANWYNLPSSSLQDVFSLKIVLKKIKNLTFFSTTYSDANPNPRGVMDIVSGGLYNGYKQIRDGFAAELDAGSTTWSPAADNHTFIPTVSALGFKNSNFWWQTAVNNRNLVCNNEIYFDNYFIQNNNMNHVQLNANSTDWVLQEIRKGTVGCGTFCVSSISGNDMVCPGLNVTYNIEGTFPTGTQVNWTISASLQKVSVSGTSITVKSASGGSGYLNAEVVNPCGANFKVSKPVTVGDPSSSFTFYRNPNTCTYTATATDSPNTTYIWDGSESTNYQSCCYDVGQTVTLSIKNSCGTSGQTSRIAPPIIKKPGDPDCMAIMANVTRTNSEVEILGEKAKDGNILATVYPNPSFGSWKLAIEEYSQVKHLSAQVYDVNGKVIWKLESGDLKNSSIDISSPEFTQGIYLLRININNEKTIVQRLIKQ